MRDALQAGGAQLDARAAEAADPKRAPKSAPKPRPTPKLWPVKAPEPELPPSNVISLRELPRPERRSARDVAGSVGAGLRAGSDGLVAAHVPTDLVQRAEAVAVRLGPAVLAGGAMLAVTRVMPFWPPTFIPALVAFAALAGLLAPWTAAALVVAAAVPMLGNLSSGLAWTLGLLGAAWLVTCAGAGRGRCCRRSRRWPPRPSPGRPTWSSRDAPADPWPGRSPALRAPSRSPCGTPGPSAAAPLAGSSRRARGGPLPGRRRRRAARRPDRRLERWPPSPGRWCSGSARASAGWRWPSGWAS